MKGKLKGVIKSLILIIGITSIILGSIYIKYGGFSSGKAVSETQIKTYAKPLEAINIDKSVKVIGLGEATHGNVEFQELKKELLMHLVQTNNISAFALEADFAFCLKINEYISGISEDRDSAIKNLGYTIYQTEQMAQLLDAIKQYNQSMDANKTIHFYGFDMQQVKGTLDLLTELANRINIELNELFELFDNNGWKENVSYNQFINVSDSISNKIPDSNDKELIKQLLSLLDQNYQLIHEKDVSKAMDLRDKFMAENVKWIVDQESKRNENSCVMISGHNSHVGKWNGVVSLGSELAKLYGDLYYCIGTDFYHTRVNLPKNNKRVIKSFYSLNPIAKGMHNIGLNKAWFDFSQISNGELFDTINSYIYMGNIGERYSLMMKLIPLMYRMYQQPSQLFDSMIIVDQATPTQIININ